VALVYRALPRSLQLKVGDFLGFLWFDVFRIRKDVAIDNLKKAYPEWSEKQVIDTARASVYNMGRSISEYLLLLHFSKKDLDRYFEFHGLENFDIMKKNGKGGFLITLHLGNGDLACAALAAKGYPVVLVSKRFKAKWLNDAWFKLRENLGTKILIEEKTHFEIMRALRSNQIVAFVLDQFMGPPIGTRTNFYGRVTGTAMGPAVFVQRTDCMALTGYSYRDKAGKIQIVAEAPVNFVPTSLDRNQSVRELTQCYTTEIERIVRQHPEQWMWIHKRWKQFRD
jgi:KDO2-lipid IV(A) lauroyltransferase